MDVSRKRQHGMTLIELMVAMLIGTVLIGGAITVFVQSRANYRTADSLARLQENARFALDTLGPDIRLARFWGLNNQPELINIPAGVTASCAGTDTATATAWALNLNEPIAAVDDVYDLACAATDARNDTDVLILRHASARENVPAKGAGQIQIRSDVSSGLLFDDGVEPAGFGPEAKTHDVIVNAYYVSNRSTLDDDLPALRRLSLTDSGATAAIQDQEIMPGVENMQVQFGVDTDDDGQVDRYVDADHAVLTPGAAGFVPGARIVAVRLWLLLRSETSEAGLGFIDTGSYTPPDANLAPISPTVDPLYPAEFRRLSISKTVVLRNAQS
jgi:prepilin-type N-terminal cleavage/methylation domain-containing protein